MAGTMQTVVRLTRLKLIRERRALSQRDLAERAGVSPTTIVRIEGEQFEPRPSTIRKLAKALGVAPDQLMEPQP